MNEQERLLNLTGRIRKGFMIYEWEGRLASWLPDWIGGEARKGKTRPDKARGWDITRNSNS
jgi:hypothetical protein